MARYVALLRGVMPKNCKMADLRRALERAGFRDVKTVLASGNAVFDASARSEDAVARKAEAAMEEHLGRVFPTIVRRVDDLRALLETDPYAPFDVDPRAKRIVTFLREEPPRSLRLPVERDGARLLCAHGREAFTAYLPTPKGPVFMTLIEETLGKDVTTRTWGTLEKIVR